jgi:hypothetical protein
VRETWTEGSLNGDPEGYVQKVLEMGISFHRAPFGDLEESLPTGDFERWMKGALGMKHLSLKRLSGEGFEGRPPLLGTVEDMLRKAPDPSLSIGAPLGLRRTWNLEGGSYTGDFES